MYGSTSRIFYSHAILDIFRGILPSKQAVFSAGMYTAEGEHFIDSHDDRAYKAIAGQMCSREIAFIYYLTKNWTKADGGQLVDCADNNKEYVPEFNSAVAFRVPRFHAVKPPTGERPRYEPNLQETCDGDRFLIVSNIMCRTLL